MSINSTENLINDNLGQKYIYIMISRTMTRFARVIRFFGRMKFSHASIGLDKDLTELYGFARPEQHGSVLATLVPETTDRFTLKKYFNVPVVVYAIPVSEEQYNEVAKTINSVLNDDKYMYNLFSILTFPVLKGFSTYKAYTCIEFVATLLRRIGIDIGKEPKHFRPDDLLVLLEDYKVFDGNLLDYMPTHTVSENYFKPFSIKIFFKNIAAFFILMKRSVGSFCRFISN